ncbi:unnamed protein product [Clonostachys solani]|uniref:Aminoglycoside phosphotransferase domain-containing protein n=1 Tax=Clonostachys solani TaxID=160281 RepID=A0A9N9Z515_9HYPO|nr:unnamed protein product [Clonostachys solani]
MPPRPRPPYTPKDDLAWERSDEAADAWEISLHKSEIYRAIAGLILKYRPGDAVELHRPIRGGYNAVYRLEYKNGSSAVMRVPIKVKFPEEKVKYEVTTMRFIAANTTIPVPKIYFAGTADENPIGLGPFIIMEYVEHKCTMSEALRDPSLGPDEPHVIDPNIPDQKLRFLYRQMADILLQLSQFKFDQIGSLVQDEQGNFSASGRPLIQNMNSIIEFTDAPPQSLPSKPYSNSEDWYKALADMHLLQYTFQHNDAVKENNDEQSVYDAYVGRQLFRNLATDGRLTTGLGPQVRKTEDVQYDFRLYSEDLRPSNVLIDENLKVVAVLDWEFAYSAPAQFSFDPPWWLLLTSPECWAGAYVPFSKAYEPKLETFLSILREEEEDEGGKRRRSQPRVAGCHSAGVVASPTEESLSSRMRKSWETNTWMINYAARNSWNFEFLFWRFLDPEFFGPGNESADHHARLSLLSEPQRRMMREFVVIKLEESNVRELIDWDTHEAETHLKRFLI